MGRAASGSRLDRLAKAQAIIGPLRERDVTHWQIGREVGVKRSLVARWARGLVAPSIEQLTALQKLLNDD